MTTTSIRQDAHSTPQGRGGSFATFKGTRTTAFTSYTNKNFLLYSRIISFDERTKMIDYSSQSPKDLTSDIHIDIMLTNQISEA